MLKKNKGFTLVELMIVLAIIGILAAIVVPFFLGLKEAMDPNKSKAELVIQTEESIVIEQPKTSIKEPTENKTEKKDLEKL